jgi:hypothetical protein
MMKLIGRLMSWAGVAWLAAAGLSAWSQRPPEMLGLPLGQVLVIAAVAIGAGMVLSSDLLRRPRASA